MAFNLPRRGSSRSVVRSMTMPMVARLNPPSPDAAAAGRSRPYDVFINHRGADTRHTVARLLYDRLLQLSGGRVRPFLDNVSMRPGDRLVGRIDEGISQCKVAVAIFSENYFDSAFCLHELASLVEARKVIVPIFYGVKPSQLVLPPAVVESTACRDVERFRIALREAKLTVGFTYDPAKGDLADLVSAAADVVMRRIEEICSERLVSNL